MTSKELHLTKIVPLRMKLRDLEREYEKLYRQECAEKVGTKTAGCGNCAYSSVLNITDHNECMGGKCTCCNNFCYNWYPENTVSAYFREHHPYNYHLWERLEYAFGEDFFKTDNLELVMEMIKMIETVDKYVKENK